MLGRELRGRRPATSMELADLILEEAKVAIVPGEAFGAPGYARLSYALGDDDLVEGVTRIAKLLAEARRKDGRIFFLGVGGSAANASCSSGGRSRGLRTMRPASEGVLRV